jgi:hypothetical protein
MVQEVSCYCKTPWASDVTSELPLGIDVTPDQALAAMLWAAAASDYPPSQLWS